MLKFEREMVETGQYKLSAEHEFYLVRGFKAALSSIMPAFKSRYWGAVVSPTGSFTASDNPVVMDGPKGQVMG